MNILNLIRPKKKSAQVAKERLQIIINHQRGNAHNHDFLPQLRREIVEVISKYVEVGEEHINIHMTKLNNQSTIEMNFVVPNAEKVAETV